MSDIKFISNHIETQFPDFYKEEGPEFIQFVKDYYEWLELQGNITNKTRSLVEYNDIDTTLDSLVIHFKKKYLVDIEQGSVICKRFLIKHINDVYRSKGSIEGLKLLFRLIYQESIEVYLPGRDIIKPSDGDWEIPLYLEIDIFKLDESFIGKKIIGEISGAEAFVQSFKSIFIGGYRSNIVSITNIIGEFLVNEKLHYSGITSNIVRPSISGSVVGLSITTSTVGNSLGDILVPVQSDTSSGLVIVASSIRDAIFKNGSLDFTILNGGRGYTLNSVANITHGTANTGSGAAFNIGSLSNVESFTFNTNLIAPVSSTILNAASYGLTLNNTNSSSILSLAFNFNTIFIGSIETLTNVNPGLGYNGNVNISINDPLIGNYFEFQRPENIAIIAGDLSTGEGIASEAYVLSSGYNYKTITQNTLFVNSKNPSSSIFAKPILGAVGKEIGVSKNTKGFLNADKYIQDSFYYQEYSYEIRAKKSISIYFKLVQSVFHPAGNEMFGSIDIGGEFTDINRFSSYFDSSVG